jgi:AhpD family alkylhydroperoxidase
MFSFIRICTIAGAIVLVGMASAPARAAEHANKETNFDIQKNLGVVPKFFQLFPEAGLPATWLEYRDVELSPTTALNAKTKELIALAVAAQLPCAACVYFHSAAATANGASGKEISEAVALAFMGQAWSKVLTDDQVDLVRADTNALLSLGTLKVAPKVTN